MRQPRLPQSCGPRCRSAHRVASPSPAAHVEREAGPWSPSCSLSPFYFRMGRGLGPAPAEAGGEGRPKRGAMKVDRLWTGARVATLDPARPGLGIIEPAAIAARDGRIAWVGPAAEMPALAATETIDVAGRWITPGLVDCHTHLVYSGSRAHEFELRLA